MKFEKCVYTVNKTEKNLQKIPLIAIWNNSLQKPKIPEPLLL